MTQNYGPCSEDTEELFQYMYQRQHAPHTVEYLLGEIKGRLDSVLMKMDKHEADLDAMERRVVTLERWQSRILGIACAVSALVSVAAYLFTVYIG